MALRALTREIGLAPEAFEAWLAELRARGAEVWEVKRQLLEANLRLVVAVAKRGAHRTWQRRCNFDSGPLGGRKEELHDHRHPGRA